MREKKKSGKEGGFSVHKFIKEGKKGEKTGENGGKKRCKFV